jgi:chromosome segregation ATPase
VSGVTQKLDSDDSKIVVSGSVPPQEDHEAVLISAPEPEKKPVKKSFLGGLFSVFKKKPEPEPELPKVIERDAPGLEDAVTEGQEPSPESVTDETLVPVAAMREVQTIVRDIESAAEQGALSRLIDRMEREKSIIKSELKNSKAEKWIEGLAGELVAERARLAEMAKKLTQSVRQKELEFKNRENSLIQSVRSRDENLRSKTLQLMRMKDQVAKLQMSVERAKHSAGNAEETSSKIKLTQTQRLLQASKSENEQLSLKLQDLKIRLEQLTEQKKLMVSGSAHAELQKKVESLNRQIEELKRSSSAA